MRRVPRLLAVVLLVAGGLLPATGQAQSSSLLARALRIEAEQARRVAPELGVRVIEVDSGQEVFDYRGDSPRILASNTKLLTTAAALDLLGPEHQLETPLLIRGAVYDGILDGDLAIIGGGDPNISGRFHGGDIYAVFRQWAEVLKRRGVREVAGDLLLVHGLFAGNQVHPDWPKDQLARWYEAPISALSFNDNCILVRVRPGRGPGARAVVELEPDLGLFRVINQASTTSSQRSHTIGVYREPDSNEILVKGSVYTRAQPLEAWVTVPDPVAYFGAALRQAFADEGLLIHGRQRPVAALPGAVWERVYTHRSDLLTTLEVINHRSQNFYAESLLRLLGSRFGAGGSWPGSVPVVESFVSRAGLGDGVEVADGSGMSRNNRASPRQMTELLRFMYFHPHSEQFLRSLPHSGSQDSNGWRRRLAEPPYRGNVFAKTGTLSGVSTLSGYAKASSGKLYAFSILCNESRAVWKSRKAQDAIVRALIDHG